MSVLIWDQTGEKTYRTGVDKGVLYLRDENGAYPKGVAWNGLTKIDESPEGAEVTTLYADNTEYLNMVSTEKFKYSIGAYMYPDEFAECDGSKEIATGIYATAQTRAHFGLCYRNILGNDTLGADYANEIHLVYDSVASPSSKSNSTVNDSPEAAELSWECSTTPVNVTGFKPTAHLVINTSKVEKDKLKALEDILYGTEAVEARLPLPDEVISIIGA